MSNVRIVAFAGSLRSGSFNKKLIKIAAAGARAAGAGVTEIDLRDIPMPLYDGDARTFLDSFLRGNRDDQQRRQDGSILQALAMMNMSERPFTALFVVEDGRPVGILHVHDVLRAGVA